MNSRRRGATKKFVDLSEILKNEILSGTIYPSEQLNKPKEVLYKYSNEKNGTLDMGVVSSLVKGLSPLVIYLEAFANENDLVVIDEPEMNLHPKAQAQFTELLGMMINSGINIIITTHSTFIVDHLANLMKAAKISNKAKSMDMEELFFLKNKTSFISQDKVSAYLFENNKVKPILKKDGLIHWDTFSVISEKLSTIYDDMDDVKNAL